MDYAAALEKFQNKDLSGLISSTEEFMSDKWSLVPRQPELVKLLDITLRASLMSQDYPAFERLLSQCGHIAALTHFKAAKHFSEGNDDLAWFALSTASRHEAVHHGFWSLGLNSLVRNRDWHKHYLSEAQAVPNKMGDAAVTKFYNTADFASKKYSVVFSSDAAYFKRFFQYSLSSLRENCQDYFAVYHVINPDEESLELIRTNSGGDVGFSVEERAMTGVERSYYASKRFFVAQDVLGSAGLPTFILDIDTCLKKDLLSLFSGDGWTPERIGLKISSAMELPWQKIAAGAVYLPAHEEGRKFIAKTCDYLDHVYSCTGPRDLWWIDQNALFFSYLDSDPDLYQRWTGVLLHTYLSYPKIFEDKDKFFKATQKVG